MGQTVFSVIKEKIAEEKVGMARFLTRGGAKEYAEYREVVGKIRGLEMAEQVVDELSRNYMDEDDDNE